MDEQLTEAALDYHRLPTPGKISILPTKGLTNQRDLALAYSPGVAAAWPATRPQTPTLPPERATPPAMGRHGAMEFADAKAHPSGGKKTAHRDRGKRHTRTAANPSRRSGETPREDPRHAYAASGLERRIVIHPRSIQDVYYYSLPR